MATCSTKSFLFLLFFSVLAQISAAQQTGVAGLVEQFGVLLNPPPEAQANSLTYTQQYLDLKQKVEALNAEDKEAFKNGISKYESSARYAELNNMIFGETTGKATEVVIGKDGAVVQTNAGNAADSTLTVEIYDRRRKLLKSFRLVPTDLENKMQTDGYEVTFTTYDLSKKVATVTFARPDGSSTAKVTFTTTGDCDLKYKLAEGPSLTVRSTATSSPTVKVLKSKK
jgi:hypothetical protein